MTKPIINKAKFNKANGREAQAMIIRAYRKAGWAVWTFKRHDKEFLPNAKYLCGSFVTNCTVYPLYV